MKKLIARPFLAKSAVLGVSLVLSLGTSALVAQAAINIKLYPNTTCAGGNQSSFSANTDVCSKATGLGTDHAHHIAIFAPSDSVLPFVVSSSGNVGNQQVSFKPGECGTWTARVVKDTDSSTDSSSTFTVSGCTPART